VIRPKITLALSVYDRHIPFFDGTVALEDAELQVLAVGEANSLRDGSKRHQRMLIDREFDACEVSLSSYIMPEAKDCLLPRYRFFPDACSATRISGSAPIHRSARRKI
jgi:hypothetical protein